MAREVPFIGTWRMLSWIFVLPGFADPVFYCVLACLTFGIFCKLQWEELERCEQERRSAEFWLNLKIDFVTKASDVELD